MDRCEQNEVAGLHAQGYNCAFAKGFEKGGKPLQPYLAEPRSIGELEVSCT